ncbi:MAG: hypothetical protein ACRC46_12145 [Thermoguttaceae bacterium]
METTKGVETTQNAVSSPEDVAAPVRSGAGRSAESKKRKKVDELRSTDSAVDPQDKLRVAFASSTKNTSTQSAKSKQAAMVSSQIFTLPDNLVLASPPSEFRHTATTPACSIVGVSERPAQRVGLSLRRVPVTRSATPRGVAIDSPCVSFPQARRNGEGLDLSEANDADLRRLIEAWPSLPRTVRSAILAIVRSVSVQGASASNDAI